MKPKNDLSGVGWVNAVFPTPAGKACALRDERGANQWQVAEAVDPGNGEGEELVHMMDMT